MYCRVFLKFSAEEYMLTKCILIKEMYFVLYTIEEDPCGGLCNLFLNENVKNEWHNPPHGSSPIVFVKIFKKSDTILHDKTPPYINFKLCHSIYTGLKCRKALWNRMPPSLTFTRVNQYSIIVNNFVDVFEEDGVRCPTSSTTRLCVKSKCLLLLTPSSFCLCNYRFIGGSVLH